MHLTCCQGDREWWPGQTGGFWRKGVPHTVPEHWILLTWVLGVALCGRELHMPGVLSGMRMRGWQRLGLSGSCIYET